MVSRSKGALKGRNFSATFVCTLPRYISEERLLKDIDPTPFIGLPLGGFFDGSNHGC